MKSQKYYLFAAVFIAILYSPVFCQAEVNPALAGLEQLYVIVQPLDAGPGKGGLIWKELQNKIEDRLKKSSIKIAPGISLGQGTKDRDIPELRLYMEMLELTDSQLYVFRIQISLATKVYLKERKVSFKAEAWKAEPAMQAVPAKNMPDIVTGIVLDQVDAFIAAFRAANPQPGLPSDANSIAVSPKEQTKQPEKQISAEIRFVSSKNGTVFHRSDCNSAKRIKPENLVVYSTRDEAIKAGKRPCKLCNP